jgi:hypothetical protein
MLNGFGNRWFLEQCGSILYVSDIPGLEYDAGSKRRQNPDGKFVFKDKHLQVR